MFSLLTAIFYCSVASSFLLSVFPSLLSIWNSCSCFLSVFTGFSGTSLYESWTLAMYNVIFSLLPVIFIGIFERDLPARTLLDLPELYAIGRLSQAYNLREFWLWMLKGILSAVILLFVPLAMYGIGGWSWGTQDGWDFMGTFVYTCVVLTVTIRVRNTALLLESHEGR